MGKKFYKEDELVYIKPETKIKFKDFTGQQFNKLTVLGYAGKVGNYRNWYCKCECGKIIKARGSSLNFKEVQSCGCLQKEVVSDSLEDFLAKCERTYGETHKYDYSRVEYINCRTKVNIVCKIHGIFSVAPHRHLRGFGNGGACPSCSKELCIEKKTITEEQFKQRAASLLPHCDFSNSIYNGYTERVDFYCNNHNKHGSALACYLIRDCEGTSKGCIECAYEGWANHPGVWNFTTIERDKEKHLKTKCDLYILHMADIGDVYKIGISTNFQKRFQGIKTLYGKSFEKYIYSSNLYSAFHLEQYLHGLFQNKQYNYGGKISGHTELFSLSDKDLTFIKEFLKDVKGDWHA